MPKEGDNEVWFDSARNFAIKYDELNATRKLQRSHDNGNKL